MHQVEEEFKLALQGIISITAGIMLFWFFSSFPSVRYFCINGINKLLFLPEYPFASILDISNKTRNWMIEREGLRKRLLKVEIHNRAMAEALQKANITIPTGNNNASYLPARVTLRYPDDWWREMRIDKGSADKVKIGSAVISDGYLVGIVTRIEKHNAWVELITSAAFLMAALVEETRDLGVVTGDNQGNIVLQYISEDRRISKGMKVSTSFLGEHIPAGLNVGTVIGKGDVCEGYTPIKLKAGAHMSQLYNVEIYMEGK